MNYQQTKTIQKYSIHQNLLLVGLLILVAFVQACGGGPTGGGTRKGGNNNNNNNNPVNNQAILAKLGELGGMTPTTFTEKLGQHAKHCKYKTEKVTLKSQGPVKTFKLPKKVEICDETTGAKEEVIYFEFLSGSMLVKEKGVLKKGKIEKNKEVTGLFEKVFKKFSEDHKNKNPKVFVLTRLLQLQESIKLAGSAAEVEPAVKAFKDEIDKVKTNGVLVQIEKPSGDVKFVDLTAEDKAGLGKQAKKYILNDDLSAFMDGVIKEIEDAMKTA